MDIETLRTIHPTASPPQLERIVNLYALLAPLHSFFDATPFYHEDARRNIRMQIAAIGANGATAIIHGPEA